MLQVECVSGDFLADLVYLVVLPRPHLRPPLMWACALCSPVVVEVFTC